MPPRRRKRLDPAVFALPVEDIRAGRFTETPFLRAREVLRAADASSTVVSQISCKAPGIVSGIDEAIALLRLCADDWSALTVHALYEGDRVDAWDTVMSIEGPYAAFAHLEPMCVGVLARRSGVATRARALVEAARPKPVMIVAAQHDHWLMQAGDGFAAFIGGVKMVATPAQGMWWNGTPVGAVPHALISACGGDTVAAARRLAELLDPETPIVVPTDYENDSVRTSLDVARALEGRLWAVRLDTSEFLIDASILPHLGAFPPTGVTPQLVWNVRNALDAEGLGDVKIIVSGGFAVDRIRVFEEEGIPVDVYGVGSSLLAGRADVTADIVQVDGHTQARAGRVLRPNARLERVK
ncbi:MAG TPA: hypothetical protein VMM18_02620 [Gemmatimonadaceae bacterium]|nr:hypothetical protein [Gemmatimonadaceae bacterium]